MKKQKIRILFTNHTSTMGGGAEVVLNNVIKFCSSDPNFDIFVGLPSKGDLYNNFKKINNIQIIILPFKALRKSFNIPYILRFMINLVILTIKLFFFIKKEKIELIYCNTYYSVIFCLFASWLTGIRLIWHVHDIKEKDRITRLIIRLLNRVCSKIIAVSQAVKENLIKIGIESSKINVIYNGVDTFIFRARKSDIRKELSLSSEDFIVGSIGQIDPRKRFEDVILAIDRLKNKIPNIKLLIIGKPIFCQGIFYYDSLKKLVETKDLQDKVHFLGFRKDIPSLLVSMDLFILASTREPFGLVIIEAMAMGIPVIASNVDGIKEIISNNHNGILVESENPNALSERILYIFNHHKQKEEMTHNALKEVIKRFDLKDQLNEIHKIIYQTKEIFK